MEIDYKVKKEIEVMALEEQMDAAAKTVKHFLCDNCVWKATATASEQKTLCRDCVYHAKVDELVKTAVEFGIQKIISKVVSEM